MKFFARITSGLVCLAMFFLAASTTARPRCASQLKPPKKKASVVRVTAIGEDLEIELAWVANTPLPATAEIKVRAPGSGLVGSQVMIPLEGDVTTTLVTGVFSDVPNTGLQYRVKAGGLIVPYHFQLGIDCPTASPTCVYKLEGGVESTEAPVTEALDTVLAAVAGSPDVLTDALAFDPLLEGQIATLALALDRLDQRVGIPTAAGVCSCAWTSTVGRTPDTTTLDVIQGLPLEEGGFEGPGAAHDYGGQSLGGGSTTLTADGSTRLGMHLRCWEFNAWNNTVVDLPGGPTIIRTPVLADCPAPCTGEIQHDLTFEARLEAWTVGGSTNLVVGAAIELVEYSIDGTLLINDVASASAVTDVAPAPSSNLLALLDDNFGGSYESDAECMDRKIGQAQTAPSVAELHTLGNILVDAGTEGFAFAQTGNRHRMTAVGFATCGLETAARTTIKDILSSSGELDEIRNGKVTMQPYCRM